MVFLLFSRHSDVAESSCSFAYVKAGGRYEDRKGAAPGLPSLGTARVGQSKSRWDLSFNGRHLGCSVLRVSSRKDARGGPIGSRSSAALR